MNKYKIIALFGPSGSGKDYIKSNLMKTKFGKEKLHEIVPYTTRPPREGEIDGVHYNFIPTSAELTKKDLIESNIFRAWWYATAFDSLDKDKINIGIFSPNSVEQILKRKEITCVPVLISTYPKTRLLRQLNRETSPDCNEIVRRYVADQKDFSFIPFHHYIIENNYSEINWVTNEIIELINSIWTI